MGQIKWYKRDPSAALNGMMELSLEERGAYNTVLDLIYSRDGNLHDDDRFIAGWLRVDVRVWKRIKSGLIDRGKLYVDGDFLRNERADAEVLSALSRVGSARDAGLASARSKASKSNVKSRKNSHLDSTPVETPVSTPVSTNHNHNQIEEETNVSPSSARDGLGLGEKPEPADPPKRSAKKKREVGADIPIPDDFEPILGPQARAITDNWPDGMLQRQIFAFRNHAIANGRLAKNWNAAFGTWIAKTEERRVSNGIGSTSGRTGSPRDQADTRPLKPAAGFERRAFEARSRETAGATERHPDREAGGDRELPLAPARLVPGR